MYFFNEMFNNDYVTLYSICSNIYRYIKPLQECTEMLHVPHQHTQAKILWVQNWLHAHENIM